MLRNKGPHNNAKCPFYVLPNNPLSAQISIHKCVRCVCSGAPHLKGMREDLRQTAYLTILEEAPNYDPKHPSGASFITFIKSRVCAKLWSERRKASKYTPYAYEEPVTDVSPANPLVAALTAEAYASESLEDQVCEKIDIEAFRSVLPQLLTRLSEKERQAIALKYFKDASGIDISRRLSVSEGRVSQLLKSALAKLKTAYSKIGGDPPEAHCQRVF